MAPLLTVCLESLCRLDGPASQFEVIVVDNGSTDKSIDVAVAFASRLNLTIATRKNAPISAVRNCGARRASGEVLAFIDADCVVPAGWNIEVLNRCDGRSIIGGFYKVPADSSRIARAWYGRDYCEKVGRVSYLPSGNLIIGSEVFARLGGFDESLETNEDYEFCQRALRHGIATVGWAELAVFHLGTPQTIGAFYRKQRWHGKHVFAVALREFPRLRNVRALALGAYTLSCMAVFTVGSLVAMRTGNWHVPLTAATAMLFLPFALAARVALRRRSWLDFLPLSALFFVFGLARALCLADIRAWVCRTPRCSGSNAPA